MFYFFIFLNQIKFILDLFSVVGKNPQQKVDSGIQPKIPLGAPLKLPPISPPISMQTFYLSLISCIFVNSLRIILTSFCFNLKKVVLK